MDITQTFYDSMAFQYDKLLPEENGILSAHCGCEEMR